MAIGALFFLSSCEKQIKETGSSEKGTTSKNIAAEKYNTFYGPEVQMGDGRARSFITISHTGVPGELGFEMTDGALKGLPEDPLAHDESAYVLPLHQKAMAITAFDHLVINWNVAGHEPPTVYDVPHFDFHFYMIPLQEQMAIPPFNPQNPGGFTQFPSACYLPATYINPGGGVPQMGAHWLDATSPELQHLFNPNATRIPFTYTFIYGTYAGKIIFEEPMVTLAILEGGADHMNLTIKQPTCYPTTGEWYPTAYNIYMDEATGKHYVTFSKFVLR
jgi:hypothetical protein